MTPDQPAEQAPVSLSPEAAVTKIEALIGGTPDDEQQDAPAVEAAGEEAETETSETPAEEAQAEPAVDAEEKAEQPDGETEEDEDPLIAVQIDGKEVPIPFSELTNGYLRNKDYTQKTQELATSRKALEVHEQEVTRERQVYSQLLGQLEEALVQMNGQEPDWAALIAQGQQTGDISGYWMEKARWEEHSRKMTAIREEQGRIQQLQQLDRIEKLKGHLTTAAGWLVEQIPTWKNEKTAHAEKQEIKAYAKTLGYNDQEISHAYDPRMIVAVRKAMLYDKLMANKPKPVQNVRQVLRPGSAVNQQTTQRTRVTKLKRRLAQTGRPDDAVAAIEAILG